MFLLQSKGDLVVEIIYEQDIRGPPTAINRVISQWKLFIY